MLFTNSYCVFLLNNVLGAANTYIKAAIPSLKGLQATAGQEGEQQFSIQNALL